MSGRTPAMSVEIEHLDGDHVVIEVTHDPRQSYSRAVMPRAHRSARKVLRGAWQCDHGEVEYDRPAPAPGRCLTVYHYRRIR